MRERECCLCDMLKMTWYAGEFTSYWGIEWFLCCCHDKFIMRWGVFAIYSLLLPMSLSNFKYTLSHMHVRLASLLLLVQYIRVRDQFEQLLWLAIDTAQTNSSRSYRVMRLHAMNRSILHQIEPRAASTTECLNVFLCISTSNDVLFHYTFGFLSFFLHLW